MDHAVHRVQAEAVREDPADAKMVVMILSGTGELANLRGTGTMVPGWIEGYVHFDPQTNIS